MYVPQHNCSLFVVGGGFLFSIVVVAAFSLEVFLLLVLFCLTFIFFL